MNAEAAGVREALVALARQIEKRHPGIVNDAIADITNVFDQIPAPPSEHKEAREVLLSTAINTLKGAID